MQNLAGDIVRHFYNNILGVPASPSGFTAQTYSLRSYSPSIRNAGYAIQKDIVVLITLRVTNTKTALITKVINTSHRP